MSHPDGDFIAGEVRGADPHPSAGVGRPGPAAEGNKFEIVEHHAPRTRSDFEMLRNVLDHWRILENDRVDRTLFASAKMAKKTMILLREIELLRSIERAKMRVREERRERGNLEYLRMLAKLEIWR